MGLRMVKTSDIVVPEGRHKRHSRDLTGTRASIKAIGVQVPLKLADPGNGKFELVAGEGRWIIAKELGIEDLPAFVEPKDAKRDIAATAAENMARQDFSPAEEAEIIKQMLDQRYRPEQIASITGMTKQLVTARLALAEMPESIRAAYGHGGLPPSTVPAMKVLYDGNADVAEAVVKLAAKDPDDVASSLMSHPLSVLKGLPAKLKRAGVRGKAPFIVSAWRGNLYRRSIEWDNEDKDRIVLSGEDGKWFTQQWEKAPSYEKPAIQLSDEDLDQAVAVGVAYSEKGEHGQVIIHDRPWLTAHVNDVVLPRMRKHAEERASAKAQQGGKAKAKTSDMAQMSVEDLAPRLERRFYRELQPRAHAANLSLATALMNNVSGVELTRDLALMFAYETLGRATGRSPWGSEQVGPARQYAECAARVLPQWISVDRKKLKSGRIKETVIYLDGEEAEKRMWAFIEAGKSAQEVFSRTLIILGASQRFMRECGAKGKTPFHHQPANAKAAKLLEKLTGRVVPVEVKRIQREISTYDAEKDAREQIEAARAQAKADSADKANNAGKAGKAARPAGGTKKAAGKGASVTKLPSRSRAGTPRRPRRQAARAA